MQGHAPPETGTRYLFLDLNSYFASVEQQENKALRGKPVAVVPMMTDSTCAIAASYEAKAYGIKTGTRIYDAKQRCPQLHCILARHDMYVRYHHKIIEEVVRHTPIEKIWSIDELASRLTPTNQNVDNARALATRIKNGLRDNVGTSITCSIGLAPNSFLAKVATDMQKPDGLIVLEGRDLPGPLFNLKLTDLPGIGDNMAWRLYKSDINTVEQLWNTSPKHARKIWGSVAGERFWYNLRGFTIPNTPTTNSMIGHSRVLDPNLRDPFMARQMARRLTTKAATRLRTQSTCMADRFVLNVRTMDKQRWEREIRLDEAMNDTLTFLQALQTLWDDMMNTLNPNQIKKISVTISGLKEPGTMTGDLFAPIRPTRDRIKKQRTALTCAMDNLNSRFGADTIHLGIIPDTLAGHVGTKIAFSRVPDVSEFEL